MNSWVHFRLPTEPGQQITGGSWNYVKILEAKYGFNFTMQRIFSYFKREANGSTSGTIAVVRKKIYLYNR